MAPRKKVTAEYNSELFGDLTFVNVNEDFGAVKAAELDLYRKVLPAVHKVDYNFFNKLTPQEIKGYMPFMILRNLSSTSDATHKEFLLNTNELLNSDFWVLSEHPEFVHMISCVISLISGGNNLTQHVYTAPAKKTKANKLAPFFLKLNPNLNDIEIELLSKHYDKTKFKNLLNNLGLQDSEQTQLLKLFKEVKDNEKAN
jgi:hypothetical protein